MDSILISTSHTHPAHTQGEEDIYKYISHHTHTQNKSSSEIAFVVLRLHCQLKVVPEGSSLIRFSYNRLRASRGGGTRTRPIRLTPPRTTRAALAGARCPAQLTSFCPDPSTHLGKPANGSPGRESQRGGAPGPACAQGSPVRCGCARCRQARPAVVVRARTHTSTRAQRCLRSAHTQLAQLPYPPAPNTVSDS